jgi:hypothetical protein
MSDLKVLHSKVTGSDKYERFELVTDRVLKAVDVKALSQEIEDIQKSRSERSLKSRSFSTRKVIDHNLEDQAQRSRVAFILVSTKRVHSELDFAVDTFVDWVMTTFKRDLSGSYNDRYAAAARFCLRQRTFLSRLSGLIDLCDEVIKDIEASGWRYKNVLTALEIESRPEHRV